MKACPWCGAQATQSYLQLKDEFLTKEDFEIMECKQCGLLFTVPKPAPQDLGKYYQSEEYLSHQENQKGFIPKLYERIKSRNLKNKIEMALEGQPDIQEANKGRLLDIGCGVGDFLVEVKKKGWEVMGIEPSEQAKNIAEKRLGFRPSLPSEATQLENESFDVITLWHVLEHIDDLKTQTSELYRILKAKGRLIIAVPNYQSFDCQYFKEKWAAWDVPRHLYHFSAKTLEKILVEAGFRSKGRKFLPWDAYYISYLSEKYEGRSLPLFRGAWIGWKSNRKARRTGMYSSLVYFFEKPEANQQS